MKFFLKVQISLKKLQLVARDTIERSLDIEDILQ